MSSCVPLFDRLAAFLPTPLAGIRIRSIPSNHIVAREAHVSSKCDSSLAPALAAATRDVGAKQTWVEVAIQVLLDANKCPKVPPCYNTKFRSVFWLQKKLSPFPVLLSDQLSNMAPRRLGLCREVHWRKPASEPGHAHQTTPPWTSCTQTEPQSQPTSPLAMQHCRETAHV